MGLLVSLGATGLWQALIPSSPGTASASFWGAMHATFLQKVILCMIAGFLAACLLQWGKVFVTGADDALNAGYKHTVPGGLQKRP